MYYEREVRFCPYCGERMVLRCEGHTVTFGGKLQDFVNGMMNNPEFKGKDWTEVINNEHDLVSKKDRINSHWVCTGNKCSFGERIIKDYDLYRR